MHTAGYTRTQGQPFNQAGGLEAGFRRRGAGLENFLDCFTVFFVGEILVRRHAAGFGDAAADVLGEPLGFIGKRGHHDFVGVGRQRIGEKSAGRMLEAGGTGPRAQAVGDLVVDRHVNQLRHEGFHGEAVGPGQQNRRSDHRVALAGNAGADAGTVVAGKETDDLGAILEFPAHENPFVGNKDIVKQQEALGNAGVGNFLGRFRFKFPPVAGVGRLDDGQPFAVPGYGAGNREILVAFTVNAAGQQEDFIGSRRAADHHFGAADNDAVVPDFRYPDVGVKVFLLRRLFAAVALGIGQGAGHSQALALNHLDPVFQPFVVIGAELLVNVSGHRPHDIHAVPAAADGPGAAAGPTVVQALHVHVGDQVLGTGHQGIPAQDLFTGECRGRGVNVRQFGIIGAIINPGMTFHRPFGGRMGGDVLDQLAEFVNIRSHFLERRQVIVSVLNRHHPSPYPI